ncbi:hypothetical protein DMW57_25575, partial [Serratia marcescens]
MKISKISVKNLFGIFNHDIPLNENPDITIVLGENGIGKTKLLEAISAIFRNDYDFLVELDFESIVIFFDTGESWDFSKSLHENDSTLYVQRKFFNSNTKSKPERLSNSKHGKKIHSMERRRREIEMIHYEMLHSRYDYESKDFY